MTEDALRAMHQQVTATLEGVARQNVELQNELAQSRQQAANERRQEVRGAPLRGTQATGVGVDTRLLGKPSDISGAQDAWRAWSTVFKGYAGAAVPRLQKLMDTEAKATEPTPNATILDDDDRAASSQLYWMLLMICKGAALNTVFLAGDSKGLEAWRQLTEKYEPKMRTRIAGQLMSILTYSFQGDATERITAWQREIATYERDSGKILDDEIKVGAVLLRLPESQLKTHLLLRVDKLNKWTDFRDEVVAISRAVAVAQPQPTAMDIGAVGKVRSGKGGKGSKRAGKRNNQTSGAETLIALLQTALTLTKRAENVESLVIWQVCVDPLELFSPRPRAVRKAKEVAKVRMLPRLVGTVVRVDTCRRSVPRRRSIR